MKESLWNRIKQWYCSEVGHVADPKNTWGRSHKFSACKRCHQVYQIEKET